MAAVADRQFLDSLRSQATLQENISIADEVADVAHLMRALRGTKPDVLVLDAAFSNDGDCGDSPLLDAVRVRSPKTRIILLADRCSEHSFAKALRRGARGCMSIDAPPTDWRRAILAVSRGEIWIGRGLLAAVLDSLLTRIEQADHASERPSLLSERESEIANAVRQGLTNKEIARRLHISATTVKTHLENIFHKLNVSRRVQLATLPRFATSQPNAIAEQQIEDAETMRLRSCEVGFTK